MDLHEITKEATESEVAAFIKALENKGFTMTANTGGASPYSPETVVAHRCELTRGQRVTLTPIARSHNGAGAYKGRGRWRTLVVLRPDETGPLGVCGPDDRDADEIGVSGVYARPWSTQEAEDASNGLGSLASAFDALGL